MQAFFLLCACIHQLSAFFGLCYDKNNIFMHVESKFKQHRRYTMKRESLFHPIYSVPWSRDNQYQQFLVFLCIFLENAPHTHIYVCMHIYIHKHNFSWSWGHLYTMFLSVINICVILIISTHTDSSHSFYSSEAFDHMALDYLIILLWMGIPVSDQYQQFFREGFCLQPTPCLCGYV